MSDASSERILDAAVTQAAAVGLTRLTMEDVVRASGLGRMTVYRRFPRRDDLVDALVRRETQRFLTAVGAGLDEEDDPEERVVAGFLAAIRFAREHPMLRRVAEHGPEAGPHRPDDAQLLATGAAFIARHIHGDRPGRPGRHARWVADVLARLLLSYVALPPTEPPASDDAQLRAFARTVLSPMIASAAGSR